MNAKEQKDHKTALDKLRADFEIVLDAEVQKRAGDDEQIIKAFADSISTIEERDRKTQKAARDYVDDMDRRLERRLDRLESRLNSGGWVGFKLRVLWFLGGDIF